MFDLSGKRALVTGASGGIGAAIARALHGAGATVGLSGTREAPLKALADELGDRAHVLPCNLSDPAAVEALPKQAIDAMGGIDILVNNAGITLHVEPSITHTLPSLAKLDVCQVPTAISRRPSPLKSASVGEAIAWAPRSL